MRRVTDVRLLGFKRFNDLTISGISASSKLVILSGPNGFGKSSLLDAFRRWSFENSGRGWRQDHDYYNRLTSSLEDKQEIESQSIGINFNGVHLSNGSVEAKKAFYIRSAYRNDPELSIGSLSQVGAAVDEDRIFRLIENDATVTRNYQRLISDAFDDVFEKEAGATTFSAWREKVIGELRDSMLRPFGNLALNGLGSPLRDPTFRFTKGSSRGFVYKNLSGGEKAAFDLLLDLIVKKREYDETVFCIDEPEVHTNPRLHGAFLKELLHLIPENCQLWLATHSIGMMREARDIERTTPGSVSFINFGPEYDFDKPVIIGPSKPTRVFWESALTVALHDLAELVAPQSVIVCEGNPSGPTPGKNAEHDAKCYSNIFNDDFPESLFIAGGNSSDIAADKMGFAAKLPAIVQGMSVRLLIDRDDHGDDDVAEFAKKGVTVLESVQDHV